MCSASSVCWVCLQERGPGGGACWWAHGDVASVGSGGVSQQQVSKALSVYGFVCGASCSRDPDLVGRGKINAPQSTPTPHLLARQAASKPCVSHSVAEHTHNPPHSLVLQGGEWVVLLSEIDPPCSCHWHTVCLAATTDCCLLRCGVLCHALLCSAPCVPHRCMRAWRSSWRSALQHCSSRRRPWQPTQQQPCRRWSLLAAPSLTCPLTRRRWCGSSTCGSQGAASRSWPRGRCAAVLLVASAARVCFCCM